jgi:hypothetical protein
MQNIVRLTEEQCLRLAEAATRADRHGVTLRVATGTSDAGSFIMWDVGNTGWTPPFYGEEY